MFAAAAVLGGIIVIAAAWLAWQWIIPHSCTAAVRSNAMDWFGMLILGAFWIVVAHAILCRSTFYRGRVLWHDPIGNIAEYWDTFSIVGKTVIRGFLILAAIFTVISLMDLLR